ncbi:HAD family hydrolase [Brevibacillus migulae]|uniref:HAD family hydrolase n=1 Tax=Brevibacillus migulae TaxID=1644114 RepID=UPI00106E9BE1|nr:HAD family hydrolase [Brevibacillus migulae]
MKKTVLFDFDGTIADTLPFCFTAFRSTFSAFLQKEYSDESIVSLFGPTEIEMIRAEIPAHDHEAAIEYFYRIYTEEQRRVQNPPKIMQMVHAFEQAGIQMGIVTGKGKRSAAISIELLQLQPYFSVVITGDDVEKPKPDPEGIEKALTALGGTAEEAWFVGDSDADIRAARAAGVKAVGVNWFPVSQKMGGFQPEPDYFVTDPEQLIKIVLG